MANSPIPQVVWSNGANPELFSYPISYKDIDLPASQVSQSLGSIPPNAVIAFISVDQSDARFRIDGGVPSNTTGHFMANGTNVTLYNLNTLQAAQFCAAEATDAKLRVTFMLVHVPDLEELTTLYPGLP